MPASTSRFRNPKTGKLLSRFSPVLMAAVSFAMPWAMCLWSPQRADAVTYYWDNNGATPGFAAS